MMIAAILLAIAFPIGIILLVDLYSEQRNQLSKS
ncbi:MAG: transcriptional regulator [Lysinibacillus sp.]